MVKKPQDRRVNVKQYKQQLAEAVLPPDGIVRLELGDESEVEFVLPVWLDGDDEYVKRIAATEGAEDMLRAVLGDEQAERWLADGNTADEFAVLFMAENQGAQERLQGFRYRPSGR